MKQRILYILLTLFILVPAEVAAQNYSKLSRSLRTMVRQLENVNHSKSAVRGTPYMEKEKEIFGLIKADGDVVEDYCISHRKNIHIVHMPLSKIAELSTDSRVIRIEAEPGAPSLANDSARSVTNTNMLHQGGGDLSQAFDGTGVLVGVVDFAFDYNHPTFLSKKDNRLRIQRVYDMLDGIESQTFNNDSAFPIGRLLKAEDIVSKDHSVDSHLGYHGTHVAGTAAGSGYDSPYGGMAPEADIYLVNSIIGENMRLVPESINDHIGILTFMLLGFETIFNYADSVGKPCVVNFSVGSFGEVAGSNQLLNEYLSSLLGPGRILVSAAGNYGNIGHIMYKKADQASVGGMMTRALSSYLLSISSDKPLTFNIADKSKPETEGSYTFTPGYETTTYDTIPSLDSLVIKSYCYEDDYTSGRIGYDMFIYEGNKSFSDSVYYITISGADAEARIYIQSGNIEGAELGGSVIYPGDWDGVIGVGSTSWRDVYTDINGNGWRMNSGTGGIRFSSSSIGPALSGKIKPDVVAPGVNIISAYNRTYQETHPTENQKNLVAKSSYNGRDYYWMTNNGTSMATPVVSGIVALWLQAKPDLTPQEVIDVLAHSSRHYDSSLTYPNNEYGYGEIDAYRGLLYILGLTNVEGLSTQHIANASVRPMANGDINISIPDSNSPTQVRIYNTNGQCVIQNVIPSHTTKLTIPAFGKKGIFAVQVGNYGSTLIRIE